MDTGGAAAGLLAGPGAGEVLATALATAGLRLASWRLDALHPRPGAETSAGYAVETADGPLYLVASTVELSDEQRMACGAVRLDSDVGTVHVWKHPDDPMLPGLKVACEPEASGAALSAVSGRPVQVVGLELLVLRPLRRAVVRCAVDELGAERVLYLKVVRPARAPGLVRRHRLCALAPAAKDLGEGVVAVDAASGLPMTSALFQPGSGVAGRVDPALLDDALRSLPEEATELRHRSSISERCTHYAAVVRSRLEATERVDTVLRQVEEVLAAAPAVPPRPTHGDFHPANVFLDDPWNPSRVTALIDVDTLGPGRIADDHASMLAHLLVLPSLDRSGYSTVPAFADELFRHHCVEDDERDLRARVAANLLALAATASVQHLHGWLALAEDVLAARLWR